MVFVREVFALYRHASNPHVLNDDRNRFGRGNIGEVQEEEEADEIAVAGFALLVFASNESSLNKCDVGMLCARRTVLDFVFYPRETSTLVIFGIARC